MRRILGLIITVLVVLSFLVGCAQATPTAAPTKPSAPVAATTAPSTPTVAPPPVAATSVSAATTKPAAAAPTTVPVAKIKRGGTIIDVDRRTNSSLDASTANARRTPALYVLYDTLLTNKLVDRETEKFEIIPGLAESYTRIDPTNFEFKLRKGVKFHDGSQFNAAVAKWNFDRAAGPKSVVKSGAPSLIKEIQVADDYTLRFALKGPSAILPLMMTGALEAFVGMVSKEAVEKMGDDAFEKNPVGSGPMKLREWLRDNRVVLEKFPGHWELGEDGQPLPYLDGMVSRLILDPAVGIVELKAGTAHTLPEVDLKDLSVVKADSSLVVQGTPQRWTSLPSFYFNPRPGTQYPFSNNKQLREAAHYATDREGMAKALGFGVATAHYYVHWFQGQIGYDETLPRRVFSLDKAKQLVKDAGYPDGIDIETTVINRPPDVRAIEALQAMWAQANIRMKVTSIDRVVWIEKGKAGTFESLSHDNGPGPDPQARQQSRCGSNDNWSGYCNSEVDKLWDQAGVEYDNNKRAEIYKQLQKIVFEDAYLLGGYKWPTQVAMSKRVKNWTTEYSYRYIWLE